MLWVHVVKFPKEKPIKNIMDKITKKETSEQTSWTQGMHATLTTARSNFISLVVPFAFGISPEKIITQFY